MDQESWQRVKQVFHEAMDQPLEQRDDFIAAACGQDRELRSNVEELLAANDEAEEFLTSPTMEDANGAAAAEGGADAEGPGSTIGPYKLLQAIGRGGFGVVYMAEQKETLRRRVVLDGGPAERLSEVGERGWNPAFSPDGSQLAFARTVGADAEFCVFDIKRGIDPPVCPANISRNRNMREKVFSPDGRRVAYVTDDEQEIRMLELESGLTRTIVVGSSDIDPWLNWSDDGQRLFFMDHSGGRDKPHRVIATNVNDGTTTIIVDRLSEGGGLIPAGGPMQTDGQLVYHDGQDAAGTETMFRLSLDDGTVREPIMQMTNFSAERVSADGRWLVLTRQDRTDIWVAPLDPGRLEESDIRLLSTDGEPGTDYEPGFSFTPDGTALIYVAGNRIWRQPLVGGEREEIPIRLER